MFRNNSGGFVFAEFAIALPLLILLMYGLATVSIKIFDVGKNQLADYVLEEEVHDVLSRLIYDARAAKNVTAVKDSSTLIFTYRMIGAGSGSNIKINEDKRVYWRVNDKIYYEHQTYLAANPITGNNYFGETQVTKFEFEKENKVLHVTLELASKITNHKIKISTAVYMPSCEN